MKCYFRVTEDWVKGELLSSAGGRQVDFYSQDDKGNSSYNFVLRDPEILINGSGMSVTGYQREGEVYKLVSVDVRTTKPK